MCAPAAVAAVSVAARGSAEAEAHNRSYGNPAWREAGRQLQRRTSLPCRCCIAITLPGCSQDPALLPRRLITPAALPETLRICRYSAAITLLGASEDPALLRLLLSNRSAAHLKAGRQQSALEDGDAVVRLAPGWAKGHWRKGRALAALQR
jgi:hypothetical protein